MAGRKPEGYRLTPAAQADLADIWTYTAETWSITQAEAYIERIRKALDVLVANPEIARERKEIQPPVRIHPCGAHLIIYRTESDALIVIRIRHGREDWLDDPAGTQEGH